MTTKRRGLILLGAGSHAREVAEVFSHEIETVLNLSVVGFHTESLESPKNHPSARPLLALSDLDNTAYIGAVGNPALRCRMCDEAEAHGLTTTILISSRSYVAGSVVLAPGAVVYPGAMLSTNVQLGRHALINFCASLSHDTALGDYCTVGPNAALAGSVIGEDRVVIGAGATILPGVRLGQGSMVGAGAVVTTDVAPSTTVVGVPARVLMRS